MDDDDFVVELDGLAGFFDLGQFVASGAAVLVGAQFDFDVCFALAKFAGDMANRAELDDVARPVFDPSESAKDPDDRILGVAFSRYYG